MPTTDDNDAHERFTRLLLESEPVMMRSILVVVPNRVDAQEILQDTAVALWRRFETYNPERPFVNWAMGFVRIETRRFLARRTRRARLSEEALKVLEAELDSEPGFARAVEQHLGTCIQKLSDKQRRLIQGYYHDGRTPQWLAERESRTVEAVYKAIQRTRRQLQGCIERQIQREIP
jgi:RNA polymerase sigma-70 factor (ECF subfamily)